MATYKVILYTQRLDTLGQGTLYIRCTLNRKVSMKSLNLRVKPEFWDEAKQEIVKRHPNAKEYNSLIKQKLSEIQKAGALLEAEPEVTVKDIKAAVTPKPKVSFIKGIEGYITAMNKKGQCGTADKAQATLYKFKRFMKDQDISYCELTYSIVKQFEAWCQEQGNNQNTISSNMSVLRRVYNKAVESEVIDDSKSPWRRYKLKRTRSNKTYLSEAEIQQLADVQLMEGSVLWHSLNIFLFGCFTGLRISDMLQLKVKQVKGGKLKLVMQKTTDQLDLLITKRAQAILDKYELKHDEQFVFPMFHPKGKDSKAKFAALSSATALINKCLKTVAAKAALSTPISCHVSRHTFIMTCLNKKIPLHLVSRAAGHQSIKTTTVYMHIANRDVNEALSAAFD